MSRSRKKSPVIKDRPSKYNKRLCNKKMRRYARIGGTICALSPDVIIHEMAELNLLRDDPVDFVNPWDISDWKRYLSKNDIEKGIWDSLLRK